LRGPEFLRLDTAEMQRGLLNPFRLARCVHEEWQYAARNHHNSVQDVDRSDAQQVSQAGQEHGDGLCDQRSADYGRQEGIALWFMVSCRPVS